MTLRQTFVESHPLNYYYDTFDTKVRHHLSVIKVTHYTQIKKLRHKVGPGVMQGLLIVDDLQ